MGRLRAVLQLPGELDFVQVDAVREQIRLAMIRDSPPVIELDCSDLTYICPEGIRMLLEIGREMQRPVRLTGMNDDCRQRIRMMGLEDIFVLR